MYYAKSGSFSNAISISAFRTREARDAWVENEPMSGEGSHYEHEREAITRRQAERQLAENNRIRRDYQRYGAPYSECYGTTGKLGEIEAQK
jgi:hypothetical protein